MKRFALFLLLFPLLPVSISQAQTPVTTIESLIVDFWPDYDDPSVLVLLSGTLPAGTPLPAAVTIPLPENARLNATAYLADTGGLMTADQQIEGNKLTIFTPALNFRAEYYMPYTADGNQHSFSFSWASDLTVDQFQSKIQQPIAANALITEPAAVTVSDGEDGLSYYVLPSQPIPAGQPLAININYTMSSQQLTVDSLSNATIDLQPAGPVPEAAPTREVDWPLIAAVAGGILFLAALGLLYFGNRSKPRIRKPRPVRPSSKKGAARFCHNCGEPVSAGDRFCRHCGAPAKGR